MSSIKYKIFLKIWDFLPFKKVILDNIKKTKYGNSRKYIGDLYLDNEFYVKIDEAYFKLFNEKGDKSSFDVYLDGLDKSWDRFSLIIWNFLSKHSDTIFDVGTNIGLYCLSARSVNKNALIVGFEPSKRAFSVVNRNIKINKFDIKLENIALSSKKGKATFYDLKTHTAVSSLEKNENLMYSNYIEYEVNIETFDNYKLNNSISKIDLISIDVEEHEPEVLLGMRNILSDDKPTIIIEVLSATTGKAIQNILSEFEYKFYWIDENGKLLKTNSLDNKPNNIVGYNVLAINNPKIEESILNYIN